MYVNDVLMYATLSVHADSSVCVCGSARVEVRVCGSARMRTCGDALAHLRAAVC